MESAAYERTKDDFIKVCRKAQAPGISCTNAALLAKDFDDLCSDERLRYVGVKDGIVFLATYPLIIRVPEGNAYGPAAYIVQIDAAQKSIICNNIDGLRRHEEQSGHHPHVFSNGIPCLSGNTSQINLYFSDGRIAKIGIRVVDFLELARGGSDYISPTAWPLMSEEDIEQCLRQRQVGTK